MKILSSIIRKMYDLRLIKSLLYNLRLLALQKKNFNTEKEENRKTNKTVYWRNWADEKVN